jgi:peptide/nickel transport system permease protein
LGFLAWESIRRGDVPMVQALVLTLSVVYVALNVLADLANATIDPRMRS